MAVAAKTLTEIAIRPVALANARPWHWLGDNLLPFCEQPEPDGFRAIPLPADVTCEACQAAMTELPGYDDEPF